MSFERDASKGRVLVVDDEELNRILLSTNLQESGYAAETAEDGEQALEQGQADDLRRAAHSLKSTSATFGAMALSAAARELEALALDGRFEMAAEQIAQAEAEFARAKTALEAKRDEL